MQDDEYWEGLCRNGPKHGVTLFSGTSNFRCLVTYKIMCRAFFFFTSSIHHHATYHILFTLLSHVGNTVQTFSVVVLVWFSSGTPSLMPSY